MKHSLPKEHSLTLEINSKPVQTLICSEESLQALVYGYLYNEGFIDTVSDVQELAFSSDHSRAKISLAAPVNRETVPIRLSGFGGVSVGKQKNTEKIPVKRLFGSGYVSSCAKEAEGLAVKYAATGGMHCSALFDGEKLIMYYEDIGRHNSFDKISGRCLLQHISAEDCLLVSTGRVSADMVKKAAQMGVSVLASFSTVTDKALEAAVEAGLTLMGYIRERPIVYCGEERIC